MDTVVPRGRRLGTILEEELLESKAIRENHSKDRLLRKGVTLMCNFFLHGFVRTGLI